MPDTARYCSPVRHSCGSAGCAGWRDCGNCGRSWRARARPRPVSAYSSANSSAPQAFCPSCGWRRWINHSLLGTAVAVGAVLLAVSYGIGATNRWREGGLRLALYSGTGIAGATTFLGLGVVAAGAVTHIAAVIIAGTTVTALGVTLSAIGTFTESGGGATGVAQAGIGIFDLLVRLGSNVVSFARLAAFGMTHAALGWVVWTGTIAAAGTGRVGPVLAVIVFLAGNVVAFALEALVAGVQALRLEFYELFSRVFVEEGRPFEPWLIRIENSEVDPW